MKIYIIIEEDGNDGFYCPDDYYYLTEEAAQTRCDELNKSYYSKKDYYSVHEMVPKN